MHARARFPIIQLLLVLLLLAVAAVVNVSFAKASNSINLGSAANFHLLAGGAITMGASSVVEGGNAFRVGANQVAQTDLLPARAQLKALTPATAELDLSGKIFTPGVYESPAAWSISSDVTLDGLGAENAVFVFRNVGAITTAASINIILTNGALPKNVYWVTDAAFTTGASSNFAGRVLSTGAATLGASTHFRGQILAGPDAAITLGASAVVNGAGVADSFSYSVNFASPDGSGSQAAMVGSATHLLFPQSTFTRTGYEFAGWNTAADGSGDRFTAGGFYELTEITNLNIYPTWIAVAQPTPTAEPSATPEPSSTPEPSVSATPEPSASSTPAPSASPTPAPSASPTRTPTPAVTQTPTPTVSPTPTPTPTPTVTPTPTPTPSPTSTPSAPPTGTVLPSPTPTGAASTFQPEVIAQPASQSVRNPGMSRPTSLDLATTLSTFSAKSFEAAPEYQAIGAVVEVFATIVAVPVRFVSDTVSLASDGVAALISGWDPKYISTVLNVGISG
jgi:hypothetical protein